MADLFDMKVGGLGFHLTAHMIALAALFVACFAITGYITFRDNSIGGEAIKDNLAFAALTADSLALSGKATGKYLKHVDFVDVPLNAVAATDNVVSFTQPANSIITAVSVLCTAAPTILAGDIGCEVGTTSSGGEIVALVPDDILDLGTTVVVGALYGAALVTVTDGAATHAAEASYTAAARTVYCNMLCTTLPSVVGNFRFIIEMTQF